MPTVGGWEILLILGVLVLLFGATRLPTAARSLGQSMRIFKAETKGLRSDDDEETAQGGPRQAPPQQVSPQQVPPQQGFQPPQPAPQALPSSSPHVRTSADEPQRRDASR
ncbi:MAG: Sec-independent protein translocase subunit TatA [Pseudonocardiaceae bacterium]